MKKTMERYGTKTGPRRTLAIFLAFALAFSFAGITGAGGMVATAEATDSSTAPGASKAGEARPSELDSETAESEQGGGEDPDAPSEAGQGAAEGGGLEGADGSAEGEDPAAGSDGPAVGELPSSDALVQGNEGISPQSLDDEGERDEASLLSTLEANDLASLRTAISNASSGETVSLKADILVTAQINLGSTAKSITIDGSNPDGDDYKLIRDSGYAGYLIRVDNGNGLTLSNVTMDGQGISGARAHVYLTNGSLVLGSGSVLENSRSVGHGGAVNAIGGSVTVQGGAVVRNNTAVSSGGGIYANGGTVSLEPGSLVTGNSTNGDGGGINVYNATGASSVGFSMAAGATVSGNRANNGGGVVVRLMRSDDFATVDGTISGNSAANHGGGLYLNPRNAQAQSLSLAGTVLEGNSADGAGGGLYVASSKPVDSLALTGVTASSNTAKSGGGMFLYHRDAPQTYDLTVVGNEASSRGGGVLVTNEGSLSVRSDSLVERNVASDGGGVAVVGYAQGAIAGTIENNKASQYGGGVFFGFPWNSSPAALPASIELTLEPTARIADNEAVDGAGLYATGPANGQTSSSVAMNGGAIEGNAASGNGGGVYVSNATYDVNAGSIAGNSSETGLGHDLWVAPASAAGSAADGGIANLCVGDAAFTDSADRDKVLIGAGTSGSINFLESFAMKNHLLLQNAGADRSTASVALGKTLTLSGKLTLGVGDGMMSHRLTIDPDGGSVLYKNDAEAEGVDVLTGEVVADMYAMPRNAASVYLQWPEAGPDRVGESFRGWNDDGTMLPNRGVGSIEVSGDTTATALWGEFSVQYFDEDGATPITGIEPTSYAFGAEETVLPTPTKDGHAFVGWYESADHSGSPVTSFSNADQEDKAYFAKWKETPIPPGPGPDPDPDPGPDPDPDPDPAPVPDPSSDTGGTRLPGPAASGKGMAATGDSPLALVGLGALAFLAGTALLFVKRRNG